MLEKLSTYLKQTVLTNSLHRVKVSENLVLLDNTYALLTLYNNLSLPLISAFFHGLNRFASTICLA